MSTERTTTNGTVRDLIMSCMVALVLITAANAVVSTTTHLVGALQVGTVDAPATDAPPVDAPAVQDCEPVAGALFNPCATLDTALVDDLRADPEAQCLATDGVVTPQGACVDATLIWESEVHPTTWDTLREAGYPWSLEHSEPSDDALIVPAEMVIMGGEGGEHVIAVAVNRPLTPRLVG